MKTHALVLLLAATLVVRADDTLTTTSNSNNGNILQNGDFSDGITHWDGDCHTPDNGDNVDLSNPNPTAATGVVVKLHGGEWTKVTQDFDAKAGDYLLTVVYSLSPDLKFSDRADDYTNIPAKLLFSQLMPFSASPGHWALIINDVGAMHYTYWVIAPNLSSDGNQAIRVKVQLDSGDATRKGFYLAFPPGDGVITLHGISLVPKNPGTSATP